ncbi:MAG: hypothetical protein LBC20_14665, partial [Planctomycetaceae bacterium]|nr:hypothetical protein [Planctomycetaceae bacterium]
SPIDYRKLAAYTTQYKLASMLSFNDIQKLAVAPPQPPVQTPPPTQTPVPTQALVQARTPIPARAPIPTQAPVPNQSFGSRFYGALRDTTKAGINGIKTVGSRLGFRAGAPAAARTAAMAGTAGVAATTANAGRTSAGLGGLGMLVSLAGPGLADAVGGYYTTPGRILHAGSQVVGYGLMGAGAGLSTGNPYVVAGGGIAGTAAGITTAWANDARERGNYINLRNDATENYKQQMLERARQIAPRIAETEFDAIVKDPRWQQALLGGQIKDLAEQRARQQPVKPFEFNPAAAAGQLRQQKENLR